jgi:thiamine-monophosphate kinase
MTTECLSDIGELALLERIGKRLPSHRDVVLGAGDDCAVIQVPESTTDWVLTSDPVVSGTHFEPDTPPEAVGRKAVGRVLSDIAAMGAEPQWALIDIVAPASTRVSVLDDLYHGALDMAGRNGLLIVGGDMSEGPCLEIHVFGVGMVPHGMAVTRSGARPGDLLFVTGELGGSRSGRHLSFEPRVQEGIWLRDWATSMIDVSDGLASDLRHLTRLSRTGCNLNAAAIPVAEAAIEINDSLPPLDHALHDGEDFELLFTIPEEREAAFVSAWHDAFPLRCTRIGSMSDQRDLLACVFASGGAIALEGTGFVHFTGTTPADTKA